MNRGTWRSELGRGREANEQKWRDKQSRKGREGGTKVRRTEREEGDVIKEKEEKNVGDERGGGKLQGRKGESCHHPKS